MRKNLLARLLTRAALDVDPLAALRTGCSESGRGVITKGIWERRFVLAVNCKTFPNSKKDPQSCENYFVLETRTPADSHTPRPICQANMPIDTMKIMDQKRRRQLFWALPMCGIPCADVHCEKSRKI
uniref:Uncharacterized protein n=1 Tax=Romanomermis culicivorax TaxID=13658 RepID=A0A915HGG2_ROMCU